MALKHTLDLEHPIQPNGDLGFLGRNGSGLFVSSGRPNASSGIRATYGAPTSMQGWYDFYANLLANTSNPDQADAYLSNLYNIFGTDQQRDWQLADEARNRGYQLEDRAHQEAYDDPTSQVNRLMAAGMSRQAALAAVQGQGAGSSSVPSGVGAAVAPSPVPGSIAGNVAASNAQNTANVLSGVGVAASFIPYVGQIASAGIQMAANNIVSDVESQYNGLVAAGYSLPEEFSTSPERQKRLIAAAAGHVPADQQESWISQWLADENNASAKSALADIYKSDSFQKLMHGGGLTARAARSLYRETFTDWVSARGYRALEQEADYHRKMVRNQFVAQNLDNIISANSALHAALDTLTTEAFSSFTIDPVLIPDVSSYGNNHVSEANSLVRSEFDEDTLTFTTGSGRNWVNDWISSDGHYSENTPVLIGQLCDEVMVGARYAFMSNDSSMINDYFDGIKSDQRIKLAANFLTESLTSGKGDAFKSLPGWSQSVLSILMLLGSSGALDGLSGIMRFCPGLPRVTRTNSSRFGRSTSVTW